MGLGKAIPVITVLFTLSVLMVGTADAIPAFSRQNKVECTTCHTIYPELNEYGDVFLKNSFVYSHSKQGAEPKAPPSNRPAQILGGGGDSALLEKLKSQAAEPNADAVQDNAGYGKKSEGLWLAAIPEQVPLSATATLSVTYNKDAANNNELDFSTRSLVLQAGGNFREKAGFYVTYLLYGEGTYNPDSGNSIASNPNTPKNIGPELRELYFVWRHAYDTPINIKVGRFRPKLSLWKSSSKISVSSFASQTFTVGSSPFSIDATEDAIEANAVIAKRVFTAAGIVSRKGQKNKEGYGHLSFRVGGADFLGNEPEIDLEVDSIWDYLNITMGAFGYYGRNASIVSGSAENFNDYYRLGADLDANYKKLRIRGEAVKGWDSNPGFATAKSAKNSTVVSTELEYLIDTNLACAIRYDYLFDQYYSGEQMVYTPYIAYSPLQNIRIVLEYRYKDYIDTSKRDEKIANLALSFSL